MAAPMVHRVLDVARVNGLRLIDTAEAYGRGSSEEIVGALAPDFQVQTKVCALRKSPSEIRSAVLSSLCRLQRSRVTHLLVHDWSELDSSGRQRAASALRGVRDEGLTGHWGVSVYSWEELSSALDHGAGVVQLPMSVLDQRIARRLTEVTDQLTGLRIQVRSIFLQGKLLQSEAEHGDVERVIKISQSLGLDVMQVAMTFIQQQPCLSEVIVGVADDLQLKQILNCWGLAQRHPISTLDWSSLASNDQDLIDPRRWQ